MLYYLRLVLTPNAVTEEAAIRAMAQLAKDVSAKGLTKQDLLVLLPYCPRGGKRSADLVCVPRYFIPNLVDQVLILSAARRG